MRIILKSFNGLSKPSRKPKPRVPFDVVTVGGEASMVLLLDHLQPPGYAVPLPVLKTSLGHHPTWFFCDRLHFGKKWTLERDTRSGKKNLSFNPSPPNTRQFSHTLSIFIPSLGRGPLRYLFLQRKPRFSR